MAKKSTIVQALVKKRILIQMIIGLGLYFIITYFSISLWWLLGLGILAGIIFGKVFCRWMCPMGIIMELLMKISPNDSLKGMYQYHKIGCPIAWVSGLLNKVSFYKISIDKSTCLNCGRCDKTCYMPTIDQEKFSLYKPQMVNPSENYSCSKCLHCVTACPNGSLTYKINLPLNRINRN